MKHMQGIIAVTATPFKNDGAIDYDVAKAHLNWLLDSGVHGVLPIGSTGEFASFSKAERKAYAEFIIKEVAGRVPVMVGVSSQNVDDTVELANHAAEIGADAVMALPPPSLHLSQNEICNFYQYLSDRIKLPAMIYNNPGSSGVDIQPETIESIAPAANIGYVKESTGDIKRLTRLVDSIGDQVTVLCGCENLGYESLMMGAKGWISVVANIAPSMNVRLYDLIVNKKDYEGARAVYRQLLPMLRLIEDTGELWQVIKYVLRQKGFGTGTLRMPRLPISAEVKAMVDGVLKSTPIE